MFTMRFDMRAPAHGASTAPLYSAAIDMCAWAENHNCLAVVLCEHHGSADGYLPAPFILASAIAARTERLLLNLTVILPFYEPVRLAEQIAVLDIISAGRVSYVFGLGYRPEEFEHFGLGLRARGRIADEKLGLLRQLLRGEPVIHHGRRIHVTPPPFTPGGPALMWGGGSLAAARRAGRYGLGLLAQTNVPGMRETYEEACREHGHEIGPTLLPDRDTPSVCFVADDVDEAWNELGLHLLHDARSYAAWNPGNQTSAGISHVDNVEELRATSKSHRIFGTPEAITYVRNGGMLNLAPLCGGIPPDIAWPYLHRAARVPSAI
jgi:alkanesulfonate monooxygenase SsuD/methylene tetrahydromethanopterin reductase-like flavin-dependent oxidoreductase (luciferase family)